MRVMMENLNFRELNSKDLTVGIDGVGGLSCCFTSEIRKYLITYARVGEYENFLVSHLLPSGWRKQVLIC